MPKVQLHLRAFLQSPYALFDTLHQSQRHQVLSESGSGQGYGGGSGTLGQQPFGTLVFVLRHHAPVRTGQNTGAQVRPHPRSTDKAHTRQPPVLLESRLGCGTEGSRAEKRKHESQTGRIRYFQTFKIHYPYDEHLYESDGQETTHQERTVIALSGLLPTCPAPENGQADTEGVPRHLYLRQSDREV